MRQTRLILWHINELFVLPNRWDDGDSSVIFRDLLALDQRLICGEKVSKLRITRESRDESRAELTFPYQHGRADLRSALETVEDATIYYPDYDVEPISIVGQLQGLKLSIQSTNYHKVIQQVLGREYLPWEVVLDVKVGCRVRSLTITHIVRPKPKYCGC